MFRAKKLSVFIVLMLLFSACGTSFKARWANFNAYYNTFYNARQSFHAGVEKNLGQTREYNPLQPIRIHQAPVNAGNQEFESAIEKAADILRKYEDTKWVDDALFIIGRSYYYGQDYFSADQKFQELLVTSNNPDLKQKAIFWRGRVLLDMNRHSEAIAYLNEQINALEGEWKRENLAEIKAILAQHLVHMENWEQAIQQLEPAVRNLPQKELQERGYFLLGQIYEELNNNEAAFEAYKKVQQNYHEYRVQYLAKRKQAEVARKLGRHDVASSLFNEMIRDDKNLDYKSELDFELARTEQRRGNFENAESIYKNLLRNPFNRPTAEIAARTYYGLAEIYRDDYNNFQLAAAYFDSASQQNVPAERLPENFDASELSQSFGNYAHLKTEIALQDSLLWLAALEPAQFDSVIVQLRAQKIAEIQQMQEEAESRQNTLVNIDQQAEDLDASNLRNGFLNADNPTLQQNGKMQFYAVWGDRPLADYWRVRSLIRNTTTSDENGESANGNPTAEVNSNIVSVTIDISRVPFTKQEQDSIRNQITAYQYQLGNLFFLSLNMPDSAVYYFEKAVENPSDDNVTVVSLYSLSELFSMQGNLDKAVEYAEILIKNFPETEYALQLAETYNFELKQTNASKIDTLTAFQSIIDADSLSNAEKAENLKAFAETFAPHKLAAQAQWMAVQTYMDLGKSASEYEPSIENWMTVQHDWKVEQNEFNALKDSITVLLKDTTLTPEIQDHYKSIVDSSLSKPDFSDEFPYVGANWDSARAAISYYLENFKEGRHLKNIRILQNELALPSEETPEKLTESAQNDEETIETEDSSYLPCSELENKPEIRGGMQNFLSALDLPQDSDITGISYQFYTNQRGIIDRFTLLTVSAPENVMKVFEEAFKNLSFEPTLVNGKTVSMQCDFTFPLSE